MILEMVALGVAMVLAFALWLIGIYGEGIDD